MPVEDTETVSVSWWSVAGQGGMCGRDLEVDAGDAAAVAREYIGHPVALGGGGRGPLAQDEWPFRYGRLLSVSHEDDSLRVTVATVTTSGRLRVREQSRVLGSYILWVPASVRDAARAARAVHTRLSDATPSLDPRDLKTIVRRRKLIEALAGLSPGDRIETPAYATPLTVRSEPHDSEVKHRSSHLRGRAVTVDNARGGSYLLFWTEPTGAALPTLCLSKSYSSLPAPNTPFCSETGFSPDKITIYKQPQTSPAVSPDPDHDTPLPPTFARQVSVASWDGLGPKTERAIYQSDAGVENRGLYELAWSLHGDGPDTSETVEQLIEDTPRPSRLREVLHSIYDREIDE